MTFVTIVRHVLAALIAAACVILFATLGGSKYLGAHHFWDLKTALIGAPIGAVVFLLSFRLPKQFTLYIFLALGIASFVTAHLGKTEFAASYAENQTAGKFWYFGWVGVAAAFTACLGRLLTMGSKE